MGESVREEERQQSVVERESPEVNSRNANLKHTLATTFAQSPNGSSAFRGMGRGEGSRGRNQ